MTGEVKMSAWDLAAGQHVRLVIAPGASICGKVIEADVRRVRIIPCHCYPGEFWIRFWRKEVLAAYKQLEFERCPPWALSYPGKHPVFAEAS